MKEITIEITQQCVNNCMYCSSNSNFTCSNKLSLSKIKDILKDSKDLGFKQVNISGGEPFLHNNIISILKCAKNLGFKVVVYSSGIVINRNIASSIDKLILNQCSSFIDKIIFNMQSYSDSKHKRITCTYHDQSYRDRSINYAINSGIRTEINLVPMKMNYKEIPSCIVKAIELRCDRVNILGMVLQGRAISNKDLIVMDYEENQYLLNLLNFIKEKYGDKLRIGNAFTGNAEKCTAGNNKLVIMYDGTVVPCEAYKGLKEYKNFKPMNINDGFSLKEIIMNSNFLNSLITDINELGSYCNNCPAQNLLGMRCSFDENKPSCSLEETKKSSITNINKISIENIGTKMVDICINYHNKERTKDRTTFILLEGADTYTIQKIMNNIKLKLGNTYCTSFPKYNDIRSGHLINHHINYQPEPDFDNPIEFKNVSVGSNIFVYDHTMERTIYGIVTDINIAEEYVILHNYELDETYNIKLDKFIECDIFKNKNINIFTKKASHTTKALTFTMDRIIWMTNNMDMLLNYDYCIINRSYLSNLLYRTIEINDPEDFEEYLVSVYHNEVKSIGLNMYDIIPIFINTSKENYINAIENHSKSTIISVEDIAREKQYVDTIHCNLQHLLYLEDQIKDGEIFNKYGKFFKHNTIFASKEEYENIDLLSNKVLEYIY